MDLTFSFGELEAVARTNGYGDDKIQFAKDLSQTNRVFIVYPSEIIGYEDGILIMNEIAGFVTVSESRRLLNTTVLKSLSE